jgi:hypothetical protein
MDSECNWLIDDAGIRMILTKHVSVAGYWLAISVVFALL